MPLVIYNARMHVYTPLLTAFIHREDAPFLYQKGLGKFDLFQTQERTPLNLVGAVSVPNCTVMYTSSALSALFIAIVVLYPKGFMVGVIH